MPKLSHPHSRRSTQHVLDVFYAAELDLLPMPHLHSPTRAEVHAMQWHVDQWGEGGAIERKLCISANPMLALAAFDAAVKEWPDKQITCRHGARVLREHKGQK